jgi:predicted TIM-barrel fold metal-dependent hydrolase
MIIDFHTHIREGRGDVGDFIAAMDAHGIDMAVVAPITPGSPSLGYSTNEFVYSLAKQYPKRLINFACVVPTDHEAPQELEKAVKDYGAKGLKLHPPLQNFSLVDPRIYPTIRKTIELDIPILIHTGPIYSREVRMRLGDPLDVDDLALTFPEAKLVIAHGNPLGPDPVVAAKHPNVYMDTCGVFARLVRAIPTLGPETLSWMRSPDKLLYGSDGNPLQTERFAFNIDPVRNMDVSEEARAKVLGGNAARLLKLAVAD